MWFALGGRQVTYSLGYYYNFPSEVSAVVGDIPPADEWFSPLPYLTNAAIQLPAGMNINYLLGYGHPAGLSVSILPITAATLTVLYQHGLNVVMDKLITGGRFEVWNAAGNYPDRIFPTAFALIFQLQIPTENKRILLMFPLAVINNLNMRPDDNGALTLTIAFNTPFMQINSNPATILSTNYDVTKPLALTREISSDAIGNRQWTLLSWTLQNNFDWIYATTGQTAEFLRSPTRLSLRSAEITLEISSLQSSNISDTMQRNLSFLPENLIFYIRQRYTDPTFKTKMITFYQTRLMQKQFSYNIQSAAMERWTVSARHYDWVDAI